MKQEWTPTQAEVDQLVAAATRIAFRRTGMVAFWLSVAVAILLATSRGWAVGVTVLVMAVLIALWSRHASGRTLRRVFSASYPVGRTASSEATEELLVVDTGNGTLELPWARLAWAGEDPEVVVLKDSATRQWLIVPRPLFAQEWRERVGRPAPEA